MPHKDLEVRKKYDRERSAALRAARPEVCRARTNKSGMAARRAKGIKASTDVMAASVGKLKWTRRDSELWARYRIREAEYDALLRAQDGCCAICRQDKPLVVDHCHENRRVRGLLCWHCNTGIGKLGDNPETLQRAADYLQVTAKNSEESP